MCTSGITEWMFNSVIAYKESFKKKKILEVGSKNVNGSVRPFVEKIGEPEKYVGVDFEAGKGVDVVLDAENLVKHFGENSFDVVITTEMLEHVYDWRKVIRNLKGVLKPNGLLFITTVSYGFPYHEGPFDYWRYEQNDFENILSDLEVLYFKKPKAEKAIYVVARKPIIYQENNLENIMLYSITAGRRILSPTETKNSRVILARIRNILIFRIYWFFFNAFKI